MNQTRNFIVVSDVANSGQTSVARFNNRLQALANQADIRHIRNFVDNGGRQGSVKINGELYPYFANSSCKITYIILPPNYSNGVASDIVANLERELSRSVVSNGPYPTVAGQQLLVEGISGQISNLRNPQPNSLGRGTL